WFDLYGLLKAYQPEPVHSSRPKRHREFIATFVGGVAVSLGMMVESVAAVEAPTQGSLAWPTAQTVLPVQEALRESLKKIRALKAGWNGDRPAPIERAVSV